MRLSVMQFTVFTFQYSVFDIRFAVFSIRILLNTGHQSHSPTPWSRVILAQWRSLPTARVQVFCLPRCSSGAPGLFTDSAYGPADAMTTSHIGSRPEAWRKPRNSYLASIPDIGQTSHASDAGSDHTTHGKYGKAVRTLLPPSDRA